MKVILLSNVHNLGNIGKILQVNNGYARNYLIPKEKAMIATPENILKFKKYQLHIDQKNELYIKTAKQRIEKIRSLGPIIIHAVSSDQKKIFGSITANDIAEKINALGFFIKKSEIKFSFGALRNLGVHKISFVPYKNIKIDIEISILPK